MGDAGFGQPLDLVGDPGDMNYVLYSGPGNRRRSTPPRSRAPPPARSATRRRNESYNPGEQQWDLAIFKHFSMGGMRRIQFRAEVFNFLNHPNLGSIHTNSLQGQNYAIRTTATSAGSSASRASARHPAEPAFPLLGATVRRAPARRTNRSDPGGGTGYTFPT